MHPTKVLFRVVVRLGELLMVREHPVVKHHLNAFVREVNWHDPEELFEVSLPIVSDSFQFCFCFLKLLCGVYCGQRDPNLVRRVVFDWREDWI